MSPLEPRDSRSCSLTGTASETRVYPHSDGRDSIEELVGLLDHLPLATNWQLHASGFSACKNAGAGVGSIPAPASRGGKADRQATLREPGLSWNLLEEWEKSALAQVSVFEGGFDLEAVEGAGSDDQEGAPWPMDAIQSLVDKSLARPVGRTGSICWSRAGVRDRELRERDGEGKATLRHLSHFVELGHPEAVDAMYRWGGFEVRTRCTRSSIIWWWRSIGGWMPDGQENRSWCYAP